MHDLLPTIAVALLVAGCASTGPSTGNAEAPDLHEQVRQTEIAFAATMAARDLDAFTSFLSEDAIFLTAAGPLRGRAAVRDGWSRFFEGSDAPFAWAPDTIEVSASGDLALSSGPVTSPAGERMGRFTSIWRLEGDAWRIVFDKGDGD